MNAPDPDSIAQETAKTLGSLAPEIYHDILQPAAKEIGQRLIPVAKSVNVAVAPFEMLVWGYDRIKEYLSAKLTVKLASKGPGQINSPDTVIAGPVVMNMMFATNAPHLREMYANLLASAMHSASASKVHPSFVQIIQQLSSDEARLIQKIAKRCEVPGPLFNELDDPTLIKPNRSLSELWLDFCSESSIQDNALSSAYYNNLIRLGLLRETSTAESRSGLPSAISSHVVTHRAVVLTPYGNMFLDTCVR
jgi:hypothetical protein